MINKESYNKISGKKTLILVCVIIGLILILTIYTVYLLFRKSGVLTNSISIEKPINYTKTSPTPIRLNKTEEQKMPVKYGD